MNERVRRAGWAMSAMLNELHNHNEHRFGRWTKGMLDRVEAVRSEWTEANMDDMRSEVAFDRLRLQNIASAHDPHAGVAGMTSGYCPECQMESPCPTYQMATKADPLGGWPGEEDDDDDEY